MILKPYRELPFRLLPEHGGACSLATFANVFNDSLFLNDFFLRQSKGGTFTGLHRFQESHFVSLTVDLNLECAILYPDGIDNKFLLELFSETPEDGTCEVFIITSSRSHETSDNLKVAHKYAIIKYYKYIILVDSVYPKSFITTNKSSDTIKQLISLEGKIVSIDVFVENDKSFKVFTTEELKHLL